MPHPTSPRFLAQLGPSFLPCPKIFLLYLATSAFTLGRFLLHFTWMERHQQHKRNNISTNSSLEQNWRETAAHMQDWVYTCRQNHWRLVMKVCQTSMEPVWASCMKTHSLAKLSRISQGWQNICNERRPSWRGSGPRLQLAGVRE